MISTITWSLLVVLLFLARRRLVWAFFGNDEDGPYGAGTNFNPDGKKSWRIAVKWWFRNPFHNFTHHVIGIYGKPFTSENVYGDENEGWQRVDRILNGKHYPIWYHHGKRWDFYFGWRSSGAFGIAWRKA